MPSSFLIELVTEMRNISGQLLPYCVFHDTDLSTTESVAEALTAGCFTDPDWMGRWDLVFADPYLEALTIDLEGGHPFESWKK